MRTRRFLGLDLGAETIKVVEVASVGGALRVTRRRLIEHHKEPETPLLPLLREFDRETVEAQLHHIAEREGLPSLTLAFNGDPLGPVAPDNFAFAVHARFARQRHQKEADMRPRHDHGIPLLSP